MRFTQDIERFFKEKIVHETKHLMNSPRPEDEKKKILQKSAKHQVKKITELRRKLEVCKDEKLKDSIERLIEIRNQALNHFQISARSLG